MDFQIDQMSLQADAKTDKWLYDSMMWLGNKARPILSEIIQHELRNTVISALKEVKAEGSCAYAQKLLAENQYIDLKIHSLDPAKTHIPTLGTVEMAVNTTKLALPHSMKCGPWSFNGTVLNMKFEDMSLSSEFEWAYRSTTDSWWGHFWHNAGSGSLNTTFGASVQLDFVRTARSVIKLDLPQLDMQLKADSDEWMYWALDTAFRPLIRLGIEKFGGDLIKKEIECLADPKCKGLLVEAKTMPDLTEIVV